MKPWVWANLAFTSALLVAFLVVQTSHPTRVVIPAPAAKTVAATPAVLTPAPGTARSPSESDWSNTISLMKTRRESGMQRHDVATMSRVRILRGVTADTFGYVFDALPDVSPWIRQQISELLCQRSYAEDDVFKAALQLGVRDQKEIDRRSLAQTDAIDQQIAFVAGENAAKVLDLLQLSGAIKEIGLFIDDEMRFVDEPLSPEQKVKLARVMKENHFAERDPAHFDMSHLPVDAPGGIQERSRGLLTAAQPILSTAQLKVLEEFTRWREISIRNAH